MKNQKFTAVVCGVLLCLLMIATDYRRYKTERSVAEFTREVFKKSLRQVGEVLLCHYQSS